MCQPDHQDAPERHHLLSALRRAASTISSETSAALRAASVAGAGGKAAKSARTRRALDSTVNCQSVTSAPTCQPTVTFSTMIDHPEYRMTPTDARFQQPNERFTQVNAVYRAQRTNAHGNPESPNGPPAPEGRTHRVASAGTAPRITHPTMPQRRTHRAAMVDTPCHNGGHTKPERASHHTATANTSGRTVAGTARRDVRLAMRKRQTPCCNAHHTLPERRTPPPHRWTQHGAIAGTVRRNPHLTVRERRTRRAAKVDTAYRNAHLTVPERRTYRAGTVDTRCWSGNFGVLEWWTWRGQAGIRVNPSVAAASRRRLSHAANPVMSGSASAASTAEASWIASPERK